MLCGRLRGRWLRRRFRKDESGFARADQLQLLANFHFLFAAASFQALDATLALLDFPRQRSVAFLKFPNLAALLKQRMETLRSEEKRYGSCRQQRDHQRYAEAAAGVVEKRLQERPQSMFIACNEKIIQSA